MARLDWERSYKSAYEVETLAEATVPAARGFRAAEDAFREGATEMEVHHAFLAAAGVMETQLPYPTIIGFDERSATLHYHGKRGTWAAPGKTMLVDAGVAVRGYGSDITRTYAGDGCDPLFRDLITGMEALQKELAAAPRPGMKYLDLHVRAHHLIGDLLHRAGILKVAGDVAVEKGLTRPFFPHGLGHFLGIQVHDVAGRFADREGTLAPPPAEYPSLRTTRTIEERMVFTIEPGLYFIPMLLEDHPQRPERRRLRLGARRPPHAVRRHPGRGRRRRRGEGRPQPDPPRIAVKSPREAGFSQPGEWAPHAACWLAWPSHEELWEEALGPVQDAFVAFARAIADPGPDGTPRGEKLEVLAPTPARADEARARLAGLGARFHEIPFGDIWMRDIAPIFVTSDGGRRRGRLVRLQRLGRQVRPAGRRRGLDARRRGSGPPRRSATSSSSRAAPSSSTARGRS